ncbi:MAG: histidine kinase [Anaerocolumna sp.]
MKLFRKITLDYKTSIYTKVLLSILSALLVIIFLMEISNFYVLNQYRQRAVELYQNSLDLYSVFWEDKLKTINKSMLSIISDKGGEEFNNICEADDRLLIETSKMELLDKLIDIATMHENQVCLFTYVPDRSIFIRSSGHLGNYTENLENEKSVKDYIEINPIKNNNDWQLLKSGGKYYFIHVYHMSNGYVGAYVECSVILENLLNGNEAAEAVAILDRDGEVVVRMGADVDYASAAVFKSQLDQTGYSLGAIVSQTKLYSERDYLWLLTACAILIGIIIILVVIQFQRKVVFNPLNRLKDAMEAFSTGKAQVRLREYPRNNEIKVLYETFNYMAEQIMKLKIDIYENMLEKQKIQSSYLRVQIQPHFYTNILYLIYSLAEIRDFKGIQELSVYMSQYFRYLLCDKEDFVRLEQEIDCLENYIKIQQIRYPDCLEFQIECEVDKKEEIVPPLLLQTFIENGIKHNITLVPCLHMDVRIRKKNGYLVFLISDTGIGFKGELLKKINAGENIEENGKHIGIMNVKSRLNLLYHGNARVMIANKTQGAAIFIKIPEKNENGEG